MLKRIAVIGGQEFADKVARAAEGQDVQVIVPAPQPGLPAGTTAVACESGDPAVWVRALLAVGDQQQELLALVGEALDCREGPKAGSSVRMREHATRFAEALGLSPDERSALERACFVRDVGKLRISNEVLLKKSVLTYDEWKLLQQHTRFGAEMLRGMAALSDTADIVRCHHECFDGSGYPDELEGEAIPRLARALKLIDVYCAMTSPRHYRVGHSTHEVAVAYLRNESGRIFDPALVEVFLSCDVGRPLAAD